MGKSLVTMEGIGLTIYPEFQITDEYTEVVEKLLMTKNSSEELAKDFSIDLIKNKELFTKLPTLLNKKLDTESQAPKVEVHQDSKTSNILPASLVLSSCILLVASQANHILFYLGLLQFLYGLHLYWNRD